MLPEHLLAALVMLDVDDCDIHFDSGEAPILDGSAQPWVSALKAAGIGGRAADRDQLSVTVTWRGCRVEWSGGTAPAPARTFVEAADARGFIHLFGGARPGCALVLTDGRALYGGRPRLTNEPAWHKLVDVLGDLGPWRAGGRLGGALDLADPTHVSNGPAVVSAFEAGRLHWRP